MSAQAVEKPNIIIIYTDDMGMGDLSCYNSGWVMTPNIDRLAANGLKFNHYYTASPVSSPSRVSLTTGMFPDRMGSELHSCMREREMLNVSNWIIWMLRLLLWPEV